MANADLRMGTPHALTAVIDRPRRVVQSTLGRFMPSPAHGAMWDSNTWHWKLNSKWFVLIGGARAAILQTAHPKVAAGVVQYSHYKTDPVGRLERTMDSVLTLGFGTPERRASVFAELEQIHGNVKGRTRSGEAYSALDPRLMYWVLATLIDTVMVVEHRYIGRLTEADREKFFLESRPMATGFGIDDRFVPNNLAEFRDYMDHMYATLQPDEDSRDVANTLLRPKIKYVPDTVFVPLDWVTLELLPTTMRRGLGLRDLSPVELGAVRSGQRASRMMSPFVPEPLRGSPFLLRAS